MGFHRNFEHRDALFDAALREFGAAGYQQASLNTILRQAGMSKGQFYYHFGSKEAFYLALVGEVIAHKQAYLAAQVFPILQEQDLFTIFEWQIAHGLTFARQHPLIHHFSESFLCEKGNLIYEKTLTVHNFSQDDQLGQLMELAHDRGELRDDLPLSLIKQIIATFFTHAAELIGDVSMAQVDEKLPHLIAFLRAGLGRPQEMAIRSGRQEARSHDPV